MQKNKQEDEKQHACCVLNDCIPQPKTNMQMKDIAMDKGVVSTSIVVYIYQTHKSHIDLDKDFIEIPL